MVVDLTTFTRINYNGHPSAYAGQRNETDDTGDRYLSAIRKHTNPQTVKHFDEKQNYYHLLRKCKDKKRLFVDPNFKPSSKLLMSPDRHRDIVWKRPKDIAPDNKPIFFSDGITEMDVMQGLAGDCWILAASATLVQHPGLFYKVVPPDQSFESGNYAGIFHFRIWHQSQWYDVVIDDLLPYDTRVNRLRYARSKNKSEFWSALLEKAYAKVYGSYEAIGNGGSLARSLTNLTGGFCYLYFLELYSNALETISDMLTIALRNGHLVCAATKANLAKNPKILGIAAGHAYGVQNFSWVKQNGVSKYLVLLRNPWGTLEWNGRWSDSDHKSWNTIALADKKRLYSNKEDGTFWMEWSDFHANFVQVIVCHISFDIYEDIYLVTKDLPDFNRKWHKTELPLQKGDMDEGVDLKLGDERSDEETIVVVSVNRKCSLRGLSSMPTQENALPTFTVHKGDSNSDTKRYMEMDSYNLSDVSLTIRLSLRPGTYCVLFEDAYVESEDTYFMSVLTEIPLVVSSGRHQLGKSTKFIHHRSAEHRTGNAGGDSFISDYTEYDYDDSSRASTGSSASRGRRKHRHGSEPPHRNSLTDSEYSVISSDVTGKRRRARSAPRKQKHKEKKKKSKKNKKKHESRRSRSRGAKQESKSSRGTSRR